MPSSHTPRRDSPSGSIDRLRRAVLAVGPALAVSLLLMLLWGFVAWFIWVYPRELVAVQQRDLLITSRAAAAQTSTVLREAETAARMVALWLDSQPRHSLQDEAALARASEVLRGTARDLVEVSLVRRSGEVFRFESPSGTQDVNVRDQDFFPLLMQQPDHDRPSLLVGLPLRLQAGEAQRLPLVMRLARPQGDFIAVMALVSLQRFDDLASNFSHTPSAAVMLLRDDGVGLARTPAIEGFVGRNVFANHEERREDFEAAEGIFSSTGAVTDGLRRLGAYQSISTFGLKLMVSVAEEDTLAAHFRERRYLLMLITIISGSVLVTALVMARSQRRALLYDAELLAASDAAPMGLFRCDLQGRVTYANETYLQLHGLRREQQEWGWLGLVPEMERELVRARWAAKMLKRGSDTHVRLMRRGGDGALRLMSIRTAPLIVKGQVVGQSGTLEDITERSAHQKAQATLTAIFDLTPDYVCQMNLEGSLLYLNPSARARLGIEHDADLARYNYQDFYTPERLQRFRDEILPTARRDGHWHGRSGVLDPRTGLEVPVESTVLAHTNAQGQIETISILLRDISAEVQARRDGRRFEAMLLSIAETAPVMIAVLDPQQRYLFLNDALARHMGVRREVWIGRQARELLGDADYAGCQHLIEAALRGEVNTLEKRWDDGGGTTLIIEVQYAPLLLEGGEIEGVISTSRDVTETRLEKERLREASETDPLTRLANRAGFAEACKALLARVRDDSDHLLCVMYLDLDRFKPVNDAHGHPVGDALLKAVAGRLRHALRPQDQVARLGGDEFAVLLSGLSSQGDAATIAAKLVRLIGTPFHIGQLTLDIGVSVGYCVAHGDQADMDRMVAQADAQLYEAKRAGRGRSQGAALAAVAAPSQ